MSGLKIIAGEARGRSLKTPKNDPSVRPILARIKKSLFDILTPRIVDARFLDLFAGTGAAGIEALSRGARRAVFVEGETKCIALIKDNLSTLGFSGRSSVYQTDILRGLDIIREKFDIIFLGPPYKDKEKRPLFLTAPTLRSIVDAGLLDDDGWVVSQHHDKEPVAPPQGLVRFRSEEYGDSVLDFYRKQNI